MSPSDHHPRRQFIVGRQSQNSQTSNVLGYLIFASRWLQAPLYIGLIIAQLIYVIVFWVDLGHLVTDVLTDWGKLDETTIMLAVLGLIDVVMIANLLIMVIIGGYETFVSKINADGHPDEPDWLSHVNATILKVKLAISIITISSIHLLKTFIEVGDLGSDQAHNVTGETYTATGVMWQVLIHLTFILSAVALAWIERIQRPTDHQAEADAEAADLPSHPSAPDAAHPAEPASTAVASRAAAAALGKPRER
ncbi:TIGR00645 family protein [Pseudoclavibacter sp. 13-3]|uniref:TIGR00645 family protein n=1 Tax=Pseudoclavibacter sp. 13-3 TaxID=2901228 RepID=UPI001E6344AF|nr:TIGR00645 family protein [Pseudoclavibacter sp. 13-3]MCD7100634.1 TIGR00645 family protein [Pseudoclavibacter sp. 13-3]